MPRPTSPPLSSSRPQRSVAEGPFVLLLFTPPPLSSSRPQRSVAEGPFVLTRLDRTLRFTSSSDSRSALRNFQIRNSLRPGTPHRFPARTNQPRPFRHAAPSLTSPEPVAAGDGIRYPPRQWWGTASLRFSSCLRLFAVNRRHNRRPAPHNDPQIRISHFAIRIVLGR